MGQRSNLLADALDGEFPGFGRCLARCASNGVENVAKTATGRREVKRRIREKKHDDLQKENSDSEGPGQDQGLEAKEGRKRRQHCWMESR
jgi:hypothetical protein